MLREDHCGMYLIPLSTPQKFGAIIFGLLAGACIAVGISAMGCVVGFVIALAGIRGWLNLGESGAWLPLVRLEYGLLVGIVVGTVVWWKTWGSRLRSATTE